MQGLQDQFGLFLGDPGLATHIKPDDGYAVRGVAGSSNREDVLRILGRLLVLPVASDGKYRTPVVTLHSTEASNLYSLLERTLRPEFLAGAEKFWKVSERVPVFLPLLLHTPAAARRT